ncbi:MAG TPA: peptidoglycan-associated lipoprotein Pal [Vicinamibacterales bacterium]
MRQRSVSRIAVLSLLVFAGACHHNKPPVARPTPPPAATSPSPTPSTATPPEPVPETAPIPAEPPVNEDLLNGDLDTINKNSPFQPVFFALDLYEVDQSGQQALTTNAAILKKYPTWVITIEGHCDERGTPEYNLALGERRAMAAKTYLVSLGIPADRLRTVSYGKEFPFDPGHDEAAWSKNRRAQFVVTSK